MRSIGPLTDYIIIIFNVILRRFDLVAEHQLQTFFKNNMKQGDKVKCTTKLGEWTLVWYKEGDNTCAIQNDKYRYIVKVATLTKIK
jgi:hypothetical protein